ncbi:MAG: DUF924 family protein [Caulobacteraceae bacterium]|nr:DUF924 family protein [Caulobacteraceae bacterium]
MAAHPADITHFWRTAGPKRWFARSRAFDDAIRLKFEPVHHAAARGDYDAWIESAEGALALMILLDQFPRNLYRGSGHAFATDPLARRFAAEAMERGWDLATEPLLRRFFYMPFMHSEDIADQRRSLRLFEALSQEPGESREEWATHHHDVVQRFGRFPHRNRALGRTTTPGEQAFLDEGGFGG